MSTVVVKAGTENRRNSERLLGFSSLLPPLTSVFTLSLFVIVFFFILGQPTEAAPLNGLLGKKRKGFKHAG